MPAFFSECCLGIRVCKALWTARIGRIGSAGCLSGGQLITKYGLMDWGQEK